MVFVGRHAVHLYALCTTISRYLWCDRRRGRPCSYHSSNPLPQAMAALWAGDLGQLTLSNPSCRSSCSCPGNVFFLSEFQTQSAGLGKLGFQLRALLQAGGYVTDPT